MADVLTLKIEIEKLETKIWRVIEIRDTETLSYLAYTILATFDSIGQHLYNIKHDGTTYDCMLRIKGYRPDESWLNAGEFTLSDIDFSKDNKMYMRYDVKKPTIFVITLIDATRCKHGKARLYPRVIDGQGRGMLDDLTIDELVHIVNDTDEKGFSEHSFTPKYLNSVPFDYRKYNMELDNELLNGIIEDIKIQFEYKTTVDYYRLT